MGSVEGSTASYSRRMVRVLGRDWMKTSLHCASVISPWLSNVHVFIHFCGHVALQSTCAINTSKQLMQCTNESTINRKGNIFSTNVWHYFKPHKNRLHFQPNFRNVISYKLNLLFSVNSVISRLCIIFVAKLLIIRFQHLNPKVTNNCIVFHNCWLLLKNTV